MENLAKLLDEAKLQFRQCKSKNDLIIAKNVFTKKYLAPLYSQLKTLPISKKQSFGKELNDFKEKINNIFEEYVQKIEVLSNVETHQPAFDLSINSTSLTKGALSPINSIANEIIDFFRKLNFTVVGGNEITSVKYNFDNLNVYKYFI